MTQPHAVISEFQGYFRFLSNFWLCDILVDGATYPSVEHAFQAAKAVDAKSSEMIRNAATPGRAKRLGKQVSRRPDWEDVKVGIMLELLRKKFSDPHLAGLLLQTGDADLVEGNTWNDTFWGVCRGEGKNTLGCLLMQVRSEIKGAIW